MRRLTLAVVALGCLLLAIGTFVGTKADPIAVPAFAQTAADCTAECSIEPGQTDKENHKAYCHVDHGGAAHVICPSLSSIEQHFANHDQDFCINTVDDLKKCEAGAL
jgi:hypothetical protein